MNALPCTDARRVGPFRRWRVALIGWLALAGGATAGEFDLAPDMMSVSRGSISEQGIGVLAERSLSGTADGWADYVEFSTDENGFVANFGFTLPVEALDATLEALSVQTNYKGSAYRFQVWRWAILDVHAGRWMPLGDNRGVPDWRWEAQRFAVSGSAEDHIDSLGRVRLRLTSPVAGDDADLDYLSLRVLTRDPTPVVESPGVDSQPAVTAAPGVDDRWQPAPGTSWQIQYTGPIDTSLDVDVYNLDLYDTPKSRIQALQAAGRRVLCYFSAGTWERWRPDARRFPAAVLGADNADWPGEKWLDIRAIATLAPIMNARLDLAAQKGCDGVDPDNIDAYGNVTGLPLTASQQLVYNRYLASAAHQRGLAIGLKNDLGQVRELEPYFDFAVNESCNVYDECELLSPFVASGKAVFGIEYQGDPAVFCSRTNALDFDFLYKPRLLGAARTACR